MIIGAKEIAADKLGIPVDSLQLLTYLSTGDRVSVLYERYCFFSGGSIFAGCCLVILVSEEWLVLVPVDEDEPVDEYEEEPLF